MRRVAWKNAIEATEICRLIAAGTASVDPEMCPESFQ